MSVLPEKRNAEEELLVENRLFLMENQVTQDQDKPLIYREPGSATRIVMEHYFELQEGIQRKRMKLTSIEAVKQAVIAGIGHSIMPLIGMKTELLNQETHMLPNEGLPVTTNWRLIWLKGKKLSPVSQAFPDYVRIKKQSTPKKHFDW